MNSGIYQIRFDSGRSYVGQAVNITDRWTQHLKKMRAGKHTKLVQEEYKYFGEPSFYILVKCHPDYLDWQESVYINVLNPELNSTIPRCDLPRFADEEWMSESLSEKYIKHAQERDKKSEEPSDLEYTIITLRDRINDHNSLPWYIRLFHTV